MEYKFRLNSNIDEYIGRSILKPPLKWAKLIIVIKILLDEYKYQDSQKTQQEWAIAMFNLFDRNKDGSISKEEFVESFRDVKPKYSSRELSILFQNTIKSLNIYL